MALAPHSVRNHLKAKFTTANKLRDFFRVFSYGQAVQLIAAVRRVPGVINLSHRTTCIQIRPRSKLVQWTRARINYAQLPTSIRELRIFFFNERTNANSNFHRAPCRSASSANWTPCCQRFRPPPCPISFFRSFFWSRRVPFVFLSRSTFDFSDVFLNFSRNCHRWGRVGGDPINLLCNVIH